MDHVSNKTLDNLRVLIAACEADPRLRVVLQPHLGNLAERWIWEGNFATA